MQCKKGKKEMAKNNCNSNTLTAKKDMAGGNGLGKKLSVIKSASIEED